MQWKLRLYHMWSWKNNILGEKKKNLNTFIIINSILAEITVSRQMKTLLWITQGVTAKTSSYSVLKPAHTCSPQLVSFPPRKGACHQKSPWHSRHVARWCTLQCIYSLVPIHTLTSHHPALHQGGSPLDEEEHIVFQHLYIQQTGRIPLGPAKNFWLCRVEKYECNNSNFSSLHSTVDLVKNIHWRHNNFSISTKLSPTCQHCN